MPSPLIPECTQKLDLNRVKFPHFQFIDSPETSRNRWYCAVRLTEGVLFVTKNLDVAQWVLGVGDASNRQAVIPMIGNKPDNVETIEWAHKWNTGSMFWGDKEDIRKMEELCAKAKPPSQGGNLTSIGQ